MDKKANMRFVASEHDTSKGKQKNKKHADNFNKMLADLKKTKKK